MRLPWHERGGTRAATPVKILLQNLILYNKKYFVILQQLRTTIAPVLSHPRRELRIAKKSALLVLPFYAKSRYGSLGKHVLTPALTLSAVAAATPADWRIRIWDENLLQGPPLHDPMPEVVGMTVHLTFAQRAYELAAWYRARGASVILGGLHVQSCPEEAAAHADAISLGNGVETWPRILRDVQSGYLAPVYSGGYEIPFSEEPLPRRDLVDRAGYLTVASMIATRGCANRCGFCYLSTSSVPSRYETRDPGKVARELAALDEPYGVFIDNNLGSDHAYLRSLCRELERVGKIWSAAVTIDVADDPSLVRAMSTAGCSGVFVGLESLNPASLAEAGKRNACPERYDDQISIFHKYHIQVNASFVFGFDHDDPGTFERTVAWIECRRLACATFHILTPYPGTPLFCRLEREGRILHHDWSRYDTCHSVFVPRLMTPARLEEGYAWCYRHLFSACSIWRRRPQDAGAVPVYLAGSILYKKMNVLWPLLMKMRATHAVWRPLIALARRHHVSRGAGDIGALRFERGQGGAIRLASAIQTLEVNAARKNR
jgi:radical SAM superfamily enzyme YgiQ (UPF0313 family)